MFLEHQPKFPPKWALKKTITFHKVQNKNWCFRNGLLWKKTWMFTKTHNLDNKKNKDKNIFERRKTEIIYEKKIIKCNILMLLFSWNKSEETRQEKIAKKCKEGKNKDKTTRKEKNKKEEIERERVTTRSERSQGERKGDTEKWTKITLFQGEKQCFCKKTPKKPQK